MATNRQPLVALGKDSIGKVSKDNAGDFFIKNTNTNTILKEKFKSHKEASLWISKNLHSFREEDFNALEIIQQ